MRHRRRTHLYLIYSLLIHLILLLGVWWLSPKDVPLLPFYEPLVVEIFDAPRPVVRPQKRFEPPEPVVEQEPAIVKQEEQTPVPVKPKPGFTAPLTTHHNEKNTPTVEKRGQKKSTAKMDVGYQLSGIDKSRSVTTQHPLEYSKKEHSVTNTVLNRQPTVDSHYVPQPETTPVALDAASTLQGASPTVGTPKIHYGSQRGDALRATGVGNSWGGGSTAGSADVGGVFVYMMKDIARTLADASTTEKVDVVFVLDETESMRDNIRGIRAYVDFLSEALERDGHETTFGLVTFTDKTENYGHTDDLGTFKNWLFRTGVDGGGDIAEAGLDALMTAVTTTKFREDAQRFIVLASDAAFHDADYDGQSAYSLDRVIETLQAEQVRVDVIGLDYLPIRQIALATGGTWRAIPGRGYLEYVPPLTLTVKLFSKLGTLNLESGRINDKITVYVNNPPRPKQITLSWKVLNPLGERCYGPFTMKKTIPDDGSTEIELNPVLDSATFQTMQGIYTIIYGLENEQGHRSILRRTLTQETDN